MRYALCVMAMLALIQFCTAQEPAAVYCKAGEMLTSKALDLVPDGGTIYLEGTFSEGLKINGLLTIPLGQPPAGEWPVIIFNHGYITPKEYRTTERDVAYVDNLARNG